MNSETFHAYQSTDMQDPNLIMHDEPYRHPLPIEQAYVRRQRGLYRERLVWYSALTVLFSIGLMVAIACSGPLWLSAGITLCVAYNTILAAINLYLSFR